MSDFEPDSATASSSAAEPAAEDDPPEPGPAPAREPTAPRVTLTLTCADTDPPLSGWLEPHFDQLLTLAGVNEAELTLALVDDARMSELHQQYCHEPGPTDVLSFDLRDKPGEPIVGDIVISRDVAMRQARERGHAARLEVLLYALHGLLHLLGYDDHDAAAHEAMHAREDALLTAAGWGPVYDSDQANEG